MEKNKMPTKLNATNHAVYCPIQIDLNLAHVLQYPYPYRDQ